MSQLLGTCQRHSLLRAMLARSARPAVALQTTKSNTYHILPLLSLALQSDCKLMWGITRRAQHQPRRREYPCCACINGYDALACVSSTKGPSCPEGSPINEFAGRGGCSRCNGEAVRPCAGHKAAATVGAHVRALARAFFCCCHSSSIRATCTGGCRSPGTVSVQNAGSNYLSHGPRTHKEES